MATSSSDPEELGRLIERGRQKGWLSIREATPLFGVHYLTVRTWAIKGYLRTFMVGAKKVVTLEEIERFRREGNWKGDESQLQGSALPAHTLPAGEANGAGGVNSPPVATLGDYDPNVNHD